MDRTADIIREDMEILAQLQGPGAAGPLVRARCHQLIDLVATWATSVHRGLPPDIARHLVAATCAASAGDVQRVLDAVKEAVPMVLLPARKTKKTIPQAP